MSEHDMPIIPIINHWPDDCTCAYELHRTVADAYYTASMSRPDPECEIHRRKRDTLTEQP